MSHFANSTKNETNEFRVKDPKGAAFYIVAVLMVYSISIVALMLTRIKRGHVKLLEDKEIHKYLREFQVSLCLKR